MVVKKRETGIDIIGALPWGSHASVFYGTRQDLLNTLVPYFKAGLQNNEFCFLVTSDLPNIEEAKEALAKEIPNFPHYLKTGQIEIYSHHEVYLTDGAFDMQKILNVVSVTLAKDLVRSYDGIRTMGDMFWLSKEDWKTFVRYEAELNKPISQSQIISLCAYPLDSCGASEFIDVMRNHQYAYIIQEGAWVALSQKTSREMRLPPVSEKSAALTPLQQRFASSGLKGFSDPEIVELFLSLCPYRRHRQLLPQLIKTFNNVRGLLSASPEELARAGLDPHCIVYISLLREIPVKVLKDKIKEQPYYDSPQNIFDYLYYSMRDLKKEVLKVIHLNNRNQIIDVIDLFEGISDRIIINSREVIENAIENKTKALIFVHNHPSGDPAPSPADIQLTRDLVFIGNILQIRVLDHIIIGNNRYFSFASEGLIKEYELDFLNLKLRGTAAARRRLYRARPDSPSSRSR